MAYQFAILSRYYLRQATRIVNWLICNYPFVVYIVLYFIRKIFVFFHLPGVL